MECLGNNRIEYISKTHKGIYLLDLGMKYGDVFFFLSF